jgi:hypothetical protein
MPNMVIAPFTLQNPRKMPVTMPPEYTGQIQPKCQIELGAALGQSRHSLCVDERWKNGPAGKTCI